MALRRFYIEPESVHADQVVIRGDLLHHIHEVCRFQIGDEFEVLPGNRLALKVQITRLDNRELQARVVDQRQLAELPKPWITLALSVPKLPKVDWIVEKCVELGVYEIRPFISDYSYLRTLKDLSANRVQRWEKLIQSATQQSGRGELMRMGSPLHLKNLLSEFNRSENTGGLFPYEGEARKQLPAAIGELRGKNLDHIWLFVGSEGGFSPSEVSLFADHGLEPVSMGTQILRVETACLALVSIIKYELGALK